MTAATLTRKQREIRQREALFLDVAQRLLLERGYLGLSMDRVAELTEYSKGTLYQHFSCKEDLIAGVLIRTMEARERLFARAATFPGTSRERLTAIGVADQVHAVVYPDHARIERVTKVESIWDKASAERRQRYHARDDNCMAIVQGIMRDGLASGELSLPPGLTVEGLTLALWAMAVGFQTLTIFGILVDTPGLEDPIAILNRNYQVLIDGYNWKPLSTEWDYAATVERVRAELFAKELGQPGAH